MASECSPDKVCNFIGHPVVDMQLSSPHPLSPLGKANKRERQRERERERDSSLAAKRRKWRSNAEARAISRTKEKTKERSDAFSHIQKTKQNFLFPNIFWKCRSVMGFGNNRQREKKGELVSFMDV